MHRSIVKSKFLGRTHISAKFAKERERTAIHQRNFGNTPFFTFFVAGDIDHKAARRPHQEYWCKVFRGRKRQRMSAFAQFVNCGTGHAKLQIREALCAIGTVKKTTAHAPFNARLQLRIVLLDLNFYVRLAIRQRRRTKFPLTRAFTRIFFHLDNGNL